MDYFASSLQHILAELERIDVLLRAQVWRARQILQVDEHFQGLYVADEEVDRLLEEPLGLPRWATDDGPLALSTVRAALSRISAQIKRRTAESERRSVALRLDHLARIFQLSQYEVEILLICLAPELDLRYERIFGYLQDDIAEALDECSSVAVCVGPAGTGPWQHEHRLTDSRPICRSLAASQGRWRKDVLRASRL